MLKTRELDFSQFAFTSDSDYGRCMISYVDQIYRKSNSVYSQVHYCAILQEFYAKEPRKMPCMYTREDITAYVTAPTQGNGRKGKPPSAGTQNGRLSVLTGFYKHASTYGILGEDGHLYPLFPYLSPCANVRFAKRAVAPNKGMSDEDLSLFFKAIGTDSVRALRDRALFLMYFFCCRRAEEIISLRWRDLSQEIIMDGGQSRPAWVYHWRGKSRQNIYDASEIPPIAAAALFAYLDARGIRDTIEDDDYLFTSLPDYRGRLGYDPKRHLTKPTVWEMVQRYAKKAGIQKTVNIHSFRHSGARARYNNGASIREVSVVLRHRTIATTTIYIEQMISSSDPSAALLTAKYGNL